LVDEAYSRDEIDPAEAGQELDAIERQFAEFDALADSEGHKNLFNKLQVARYKVALTEKS
jgi:hypothetical protein